MALPPRHSAVEATLVQKDEALWLRKVRREVVEELGSQFLTTFSADQYFL